jgi:hypothetical protein
VKRETDVNEDEELEYSSLSMLILNIYPMAAWSIWDEILEEKLMNIGAYLKFYREVPSRTLSPNWSLKLARVMLL